MSWKYFILILSLMFTACETIDCTLNNVVLCHIGFYDSSTGKNIATADTLSITATGTDSILFNRGVNVSKVTLPMSYRNEADTLTFHFWNDNYAMDATLFINKTNKVHYESPDCPATMFHTIQSISNKSDYDIIDSIIVTRPAVNYETAENIRIYFHTAD